CTQAVIWQRISPTPLLASVNLSIVQLRQPGLPATVAAILDRTGLDPHLLMLEVTEDALIDGATTIDTLHALRGIGVQLAIDDFGTGYSNLASLHTIPAHTLKLDAGFITELEHHHDTNPANIMLSTLIRLGHDLNLTVIAEGIHAPAQAQYL